MGALAYFGVAAKVRRERDTGQFASEIGHIASAVFRVMEQGVSVTEDVPLGDGTVAVMAEEFDRLRTLYSLICWPVLGFHPV